MRVLLTTFAIISLLGCKKDPNEIEWEAGYVPDIIHRADKTSEGKHTDSLIKVGKLSLGDPKYIIRHPGDDQTYDLYYGSLGNLKPTTQYISLNKWTVTYRYDNYAKAGCSTVLLWHNAKTVQIDNLPEGRFNSKEFEQWAQVDGVVLLTLLK